MAGLRLKSAMTDCRVFRTHLNEKEDEYKMSKKLLVVEDDPSISDIIIFNAEMVGYECEAAYDGEVGLKMAKDDKYDLILLDVMLPKIEGFEICKLLRKEGVSTPIIMVTAREDEVDKVLGLELGADDYIAKPFGVKELLARIKANIRRSENDAGNASASDSSQNTASLITIHSMTIDDNKRKVEKNEIPIDLSKIEYDLLLFFVKNPGKIFSRENLLTSVWKYDDLYGDGRTVDTTIRRLRMKIEDDPSNPQFIKTKPKAGWYLEN